MSVTNYFKIAIADARRYADIGHRLPTAVPETAVIPASTRCAAETIASHIRLCRSELHDLSRQAYCAADCQRIDDVLTGLIEEFSAIQILNLQRKRALEDL